MDPNIHPIILSQGHVSKAVADVRFFETLPEFRSLQAKMATMNVDLTEKRGCGSCRRSRVASNLFNDFLSITTSLSPDGLQRLKTYLGTPQLMVNLVDRTNGSAELRVL